MLNYITIFLTALLSVYGLHYAWIAVAGALKKDRTIPVAEPAHRIAALVPARNEERVIGYLVDSLMKQRYPRELYDVYVLINNCSDRTREKAESHGAKIIECGQQVNGKGEVLRFAFEKLLSNDEPAYDAFCIFDADNLVDSGFLQAANNTLCAGYQLAQGYRDSKNPKDSWVAGSSSVFFWFMSSLYNRSRARLGMSAALNGTGILISSALLREQGFNTTTLTEDLEYTAQSILNKHKIGWMNDAIIYDEQPTRLKDSFTQHRRWGAGSLQCSRRYLGPLLRMALREKSMDALDVALLFMGAYVQAIGCIPALLTVLVLALQIIKSPALGMGNALATAGVALVAGVFLYALFTYVIAAIEKKVDRLNPSTYVLMCAYMLAWMPANLMNLIVKPPKWTSIQHVSAVDISHCESPVTRAPKRPLAQTKENGV